MDGNAAHSEMTAAEFKCYFDRYYDQIRNFCYYKCGDPALAEDLTQETFLQVWRKRAEIRQETLANLLYTIAGNLYTSEARHQQVVFRFEQIPKQDRDHEDPSYLLELEQFREQLDQAIAALPEGSREVFLMNRIDKLKYQEIADMLGISIKAVEKRMYIALKNLRKLTGKL